MQLIAKDVWQLTGFPRHFINAYLVEDVLIDAATRWAKRRIVRQVGDRRLRLLALTHCHPDHQGSARALCEHWGIPLACHEADVAVMEGRARMRPDNWIVRLGSRLWGGPSYPVTRVLQEGDELAGFRVIHAPGHTPGHVIFFREGDRIALAGDVLANIHFLTGQTGLREPPAFFSEDPAENRRSIQTLIDLKPNVVCFGHGPPLRNPELLYHAVADWTRVAAPVIAPVAGPTG
jgi:glyoxylase-like metal-dependent hydrolase (beta-lactamase superfamily II)